MPLLARTLRQLATYDADVWLTVPDQDPVPYAALADDFGVRAAVGDPGRNEFESSRPFWSPNETNVLLLGDVWFTDEALATVMGRAGEGYRFFGREQSSALTGSRWGEIFANSWSGREIGNLSRLTDEVRAAQDAGLANSSSHGWTLLRMIQGTPLQHHFVCGPWWVEIDDATDDIDFPVDFDLHPATRAADTEEVQPCV